MLIIVKLRIILQRESILWALRRGKAVSIVGQIGQTKVSYIITKGLRGGYITPLGAAESAELALRKVESVFNQILQYREVTR